MIMEDFNIGDMVKWAYTHHLNSVSTTQITKTGEYWGKIKHTRRYLGPQLACVMFKGNKRFSKVPLIDLKPFTP